MEICKHRLDIKWCPVCSPGQKVSKSVFSAGLSVEQINEAISLLRHLTDYMLPDWHSRCDDICVKEMKEYEHKIDDLLDRIDI
jgi:hypothetical protein